MEAPPAKPRPPLPDGPYLVVGLARSGAAVARVLAARGERVIGCDSGSPAEAEGLEGAGVEVNLNVDGAELVSEAAAVVKSPGVPRDAPAVAAARESEIPVIGELEASWRLLGNRFVAVTGTNGKTTVSELIGHVLRTAGDPVEVAGNVGTPLASLVDSVSQEATIVAECSSFQLEDADAFAPECAVFLNFSPDHLDRHGSLKAYLAAKLRVFAHQGPDDVAIYNGDEPVLAGRELGGAARRLAFCGGRRAAGPPDHGRLQKCFVRRSDDAIVSGDERVLETSELRLLGAHNAENAMAAAAAALALGTGPGDVREGLRSFGGVPHRLEPVRDLDGVLYVNDSKATNVSAARAALLSFEGGVRAILGGSPKGGGFDELAEPVAERCVACYLIGPAAERLERDLLPAREQGVELHVCAGLPEAVSTAALAARPGETVLLAPACASFDAYRDFEQRGEHFRSLVEELR